MSSACACGALWCASQGLIALPLLVDFLLALLECDLFAVRFGEEFRLGKC